MNDVHTYIFISKILIYIKKFINVYLKLVYLSYIFIYRFL